MRHLNAVISILRKHTSEHTLMKKYATRINKAYTYLVILFLLTGNYACKVLDQDPISVIPADSFFKDLAQAEGAVIGCYDACQVDAMWLVLRGDGRSDLYRSGVGTARNNLINNNLQISNNPDPSWAVTYDIINAANNVIYATPRIAVTAEAARVKQDQLVGEALFLRAWMYFNAVRNWRNVPLITYPLIRLDSLQSAAKYQRFYDHPSYPKDDAVLVQIEQDLLAAELSLPVDYGSATIQTRGRATKGAARALLATVYLWRASYEQRPEFYAKAAGYAQQVIADATRYKLLPASAYGTLFTTRNTEESIFELQFNSQFNESNGLAASFYPDRPWGRGGDHTLEPSTTIINAFEAGDIRKDVSIQHTGNPARDPWTTNNRFYVNKYQGTLTPTGRERDDNLKILRLADMYLIKAEALNEMGETGPALEALNVIRDRAFNNDITKRIAPADQEVVREAIANERFKELCFEGHRWYDLVRTHQLEEKQPSLTDTPEKLTRQRIFPIQNGQISEGFIQNPGY